MKIDLTKRAGHRTDKMSRKEYQAIHPVLRNLSSFVDKTPGGHRYKMGLGRLDALTEIVSNLPEGAYSVGYGKTSMDTKCILLFIDHE